MIELGEIVGPVMHLAGGEYAGVVDQDIEMAKALDHRLDEALDLLGIGLVGLEGVGAYALRPRARSTTALALSAEAE